MDNNYKFYEKDEANYWNWNGFKIFWSIKGADNNQPIILLHGFGASSQHWRKNSNYFAIKGYAVYSIDLIGFGNSAQPGINEIGKLDNEVWCKQVSDFIKQVIILDQKDLRKILEKNYLTKKYPFIISL